MHSKWDRSNLEKYVVYDKKKWRYSDQDKDGMLNRQEYEYFHHPKEHEIMLPYIAVVGVNKFEFFFPLFPCIAIVELGFQFGLIFALDHNGGYTSFTCFCPILLCSVLSSSMGEENT